MALKLFVSNALSALSSRLCESLKNRKYAVFQPFTIVTQTEGMSNWLTLEIAKKNGIAAHIQYKKPGAIIQQVYRTLGGSSAAVLARQHMDWLIDQVLDSSEFRHIFKDKAAYYHDDPGTETMKRMSLARRLADLFDQYQIYRSQTIRKWSERPWQEAEPGFQWQAYIWQALKKIAGDAVPDMTNLSTYILDALQDSGKIKKLQQTLPEINLFGLSIITQFHIRIFYELARYIDLNFYLLNPAPDIYWIEDRSEKEVIRLTAKYQSNPDMLPTEGNALLTSWGKVLQHTFGMLYQTESFINQQEEVDVTPPERNTLLQKIQNDIFHNLTDTPDFQPEDLSDESIIIQSNYSRPREVQSLYNYLADMLHHHKEDGLSANDILVMVHPIEEYAPYIRGVFEHAPIALPFHIADEPATQGNTPLSSLVALMEISEVNFTAENVLQLLEFDAIRNHFGIYDLQHIRESVQSANIRFGIKNEVHDDSYTVSWANGINRMMYGLCISGEQPYQIEGAPSFYCLDNSEGAEKMQQTIRFCSWVTALMKTIRDRNRRRSLQEWMRYTEELMEQFIDFNEDDDTFSRTIIRQLEQYEPVAALISAEWDFDTFSRHLCSHLQQEQQSKVFSSGGITFCSQIPMRSIPFKVIAMLGLGLNDFPRKTTHFDFDLIRYHPQLGDRNIKDNDRHLFLETLLSAQSKLYLSYIGRSVKDNSAIPPSVLLDELLDYIQQGINRHSREHNQSAIDVREKMIVQQPLHNFSSRYNKQDRSLVNYLLYRHKPEEWTRTEHDLPSEPSEYLSLSVKDFVMLCINPVKFYYQKKLRIFLNEESLIIPDTELFHLDALDKNLLQKQLLQALLHGENMEIVRSRLLKQGKLPLKNMSIVAAIQEEENAQSLFQQLNSVMPDSQQEVFKVELDIPGYYIKGNLDSVFNNHYVYFNFTGKDKNLIEAYIRFLLGKACGLEGGYVISTAAILRFAPLTKDEAADRLKIIANLLQDQMDKPAFFGKDLLLSEKKAEHLDDNTLQDFIQKAIESPNPTCHDPYIKDAYLHNMMHRPGLSEDYLLLFHHLYLAAKDTLIQN